MNPEFESITSFDKLKLGLEAAHLAIKASLPGELPIEPNQNYSGVTIIPADSFPVSINYWDTPEFDS